MSSTLNIRTYQKSDRDFDDPCIATFHDWTSSEPINGSSYFHYKNGTFYLDISYHDLDSYTIIIEQDLNSIPEFPSWLILPLFLIATFSVILLKKRLNSKHVTFSLVESFSICFYFYIYRFLQYI